MSEIKKLIQNIENLENYLDSNSTKILDFFQQDFKSLLAYREDIEKFISLNHITIKGLDKARYSDFILLLLEVSERLGLEAEFLLLFNILKENKIPISNRLIASSLFLTNINNSSEFLSIYDEFIEYLQKGYELEEDNEEKIIFTFLNYFSQGLSYFGEFNQKVIADIKLKFSDSIKSKKYAFLENTQINSVLGLDIKNFENTFNKVKEITDNILGINYLENIEIFSPSKYLIETDTSYSNDLSKIATNFLSIREYNKENFYKLDNQDKIYRELRKGVHILETLEQLTAYMFSYGNMHYYKLEDAFKNLPKLFFNNKIDIIDWACGQGVASMAYLTYLRENNIKQEIDIFTLIEPSQIALKRASLHVNHFHKNSKITTINKDLNELFKTELNDKSQNVKLHLFSNILDIDTFQLSDLTQFIGNSFKGKNYFVIVSPLIPNSRKLRINEFVNYYKKENGFKLLYNIDSHSGEWIKNWSRMIRIFEVNIE